MSQPDFQEGVRHMTPQSLAELHEKSRRNNERNKRKAENKKNKHLARIAAIPMVDLGPEGQWPEFGPMRADGGFSVTYPKPVGTREWKEDPQYKASLKTSEHIEKERIEEFLKHWPWRQTIPRCLVTLAPFRVNNFRDTTRLGQPFALAEVTQTCLLFEKLFPNELIRQKLTDLLFVNHDTASKFALTSRQSWRITTSSIAHWDFTRGWFGNCEIERDSENDDSIGNPIEGSVASVVIVSPVRGPLAAPSNIEQLDEVKEAIDRHLYKRQLMHLHKMCTAMYNFADYFQNLQLHRIPYLTTDVLSLIIPPMRNLKVLGIYKCPLIHVGDTLKLLEIIQVDKPLEKKNQISLDFYPNYHQGPIPFPGNKYHQGTYGVTWDNWNGDTRLAVWQLASIIIPQAIEQKQDFLSKHTMFRQWLDTSPCWRVAETLATLQVHPGDTRSQYEIDEDFVVMVDFPNTGGSKTKFKSDRPNCPEGWEWKLERHPCYVCGLNPLGIFFYYDDIRSGIMDHQNGNSVQMKCLACRLVHWLNNESDHYKRQKRHAIKCWLLEEVDEETGEETWNDTNMPKALEVFKEKKIWGAGQKLDRQRVERMHDPVEPLDREYDEGQKPLTREELGRLGMKNRSPTVDSKDPVFDQWNAWDPSRLFAHGHGSPW